MGSTPRRSISVVVFNSTMHKRVDCDRLLTTCVGLPIDYVDMSRFFNQPLVCSVCVIHDVVYQFCENKNNNFKNITI